MEAGLDSGASIKHLISEGGDGEDASGLGILELISTKSTLPALLSDKDRGHFFLLLV